MVNVKFKYSKRNFNLKFYILDDLIVDAILGKEFLISNNFVVDLPKMKIKIDKEYVVLKQSELNDNTNSCEFDKNLIEKLYMTKCDSESQKIIEKIENYSKDNF
ncbi:hypothetical protein DMUE_5304 [Dictyocoela muelleri]|nr:hypothetical protein DMUE_5304 [Dictyocoela muelleri]